MPNAARTRRPVTIGLRRNFIGSKVQGPKSKVQSPRSKVQGLKSLKSAIANCKLQIANFQFAIRRWPDRRTLGFGLWALDFGRSFRRLIFFFPRPEIEGEGGVGDGAGAAGNIEFGEIGAF